MIGSWESMQVASEGSGAMSVQGKGCDSESRSKGAPGKCQRCRGVAGQRFVHTGGSSSLSSGKQYLGCSAPAVRFYFRCTTRGGHIQSLRRPCRASSRTAACSPGRASRPWATASPARASLRGEEWAGCGRAACPVAGPSALGGRCRQRHTHVLLLRCRPRRCTRAPQCRRPGRSCPSTPT